MLARYTMLRGKPATVVGVRIDTRKHTRHCLRPSIAMVTRYLDPVDEYAWEQFEADYWQLVTDRFAADPRPFDALAERACNEEVYLGCSCPTKKNPNVNHCHTVLALRFMSEHYPALDIVFPTGLAE